MSSKGIKRSLFKRNFALPVFRALAAETRRDLRKMRKCVFSDHPVQIRNTAEWLALVHDLPDDSYLKQYIQQRSEIVLQRRAQGRITFTDEKEQGDYLYKFHSSTSNIPDELLKYVTYKVCPKIANGDLTIDALDPEELDGVMRWTTAARQDFYLALLATQTIAGYFLTEVFPRFLADCKSTVQPSMIRSVLAWFQDELRFNSRDSFSLYVAAPIGEVEDIHEYTRDYMNKWCRSSCNCRCLEPTKCKHRALSAEWISRISDRVKDRDSRLKDLDIDAILSFAKMLDNLQARLLRYPLKMDTEMGSTLYDSVRNEFRSQIERFDTYIDCYGDPELISGSSAVDARPCRY